MWLIGHFLRTFCEQVFEASRQMKPNAQVWLIGHFLRTFCEQVFETFRPMKPKCPGVANWALFEASRQMKPNAQVWLIGHSAGSHLCAMLLSSPWYDGLPTAARKVFVFCMWSYQKIRTSMSARRRVIYTPEEFF